MANKDIQKILVPVDGSESSFNAASFAIAMAKKYGASMHMLHVVHVEQVLRVLGIHASSSSYSEEVDKHVKVAKLEADKWFERIDKEARDQFVNIMATDVKGTSFSIVGEIVDYAERNNMDLIVLGTRGLGGFAKLLMGSVATGVVNYSPCPVLTVR